MAIRACCDPGYTGPTCGDAFGSGSIGRLSARRSALSRTSGADDAVGGCDGPLGCGVGLTGGCPDGDGGGSEGRTEGDAPPSFGAGSSGGCGCSGRCPPPDGRAAVGDAESLAPGEASASPPSAFAELSSGTAGPPRPC